MLYTKPTKREIAKHNWTSTLVVGPLGLFICWVVAWWSELKKKTVAFVNCESHVFSSMMMDDCPMLNALIYKHAFPEGGVLYYLIKLLVGVAFTNRKKRYTIPFSHQIPKTLNYNKARSEWNYYSANFDHWLVFFFKWLSLEKVNTNNLNCI